MVTDNLTVGVVIEQFCLAGEEGFQSERVSPRM